MVSMGTLYNIFGIRYCLYIVYFAKLYVFVMFLTVQLQRTSRQIDQLNIQSRGHGELQIA